MCPHHATTHSTRAQFDHFRLYSHRASNHSTLCACPCSAANRLQRLLDAANRHRLFLGRLRQLLLGICKSFLRFGSSRLRRPVVHICAVGIESPKYALACSRAAVLRRFSSASSITCSKFPRVSLRQLERTLVDGVLVCQPRCGHLLLEITRWWCLELSWCLCRAQKPPALP